MKKRSRYATAYDLGKAFEMPLSHIYPIVERVLDAKLTTRESFPVCAYGVDEFVPIAVEWGYFQCSLTSHRDGTIVCTEN